MSEYIPATRPPCQHPYFLTVKERDKTLPGWKLVDFAYIPVKEQGVPEECSECNNMTPLMYFRALDTAGNFVSGVNVVVDTPTLSDQYVMRPRGELDYCFDPQGITYYGIAVELSPDSNFSTDRREVGPYVAYMLGNSDVLQGMGMPSKRHVNFIATWQRVEVGTEPPPDPDDPPPTDAIEEGMLFRVKRADAKRIVMVRVP